MTDIHECIQNAMRTYYINQFYGKIKIHLVIQHLLKLTNLQYIQGDPSILSRAGQYRWVTL